MNLPPYESSDDGSDDDDTSDTETSTESDTDSCEEIDDSQFVRDPNEEFVAYSDDSYGNVLIADSDDDSGLSCFEDGVVIVDDIDECEDE